MYTGDYSEFVQNGIKFLDREGPENWRDLIVKDEILMHQPDKCVLGQIYGDYNEACGNRYAMITTMRAGELITTKRSGELGILHSTYPKVGRSAFYGFMIVNDDFRADNWEILRDAWLAVL